MEKAGKAAPPSWLLRGKQRWCCSEPGIRLKSPQAGGKGRTGIEDNTPKWKAMWAACSWTMPWKDTAVINRISLIWLHRAEPKSQRAVRRFINSTQSQHRRNSLLWKPRKAPILPYFLQFFYVEARGNIYMYRYIYIKLYSSGRLLFGSTWHAANRSWCSSPPARAG